jgi:coenzyme F420-reducing hydrogenase delta subunit
VVTTQPRITAFVCANSRRPALDPSLGPQAARLPVLPWPEAAEQVTVACTGRLQPEHLLRAFEAGADLVCIVACDEGNCHHLEGSRRAARRTAFVQALLDQIGGDSRRLMLLHLPGTAKQDMAAGLPGGAAPASGPDDADLAAKLAAEVAARLAELPPNPLRRPAPPIPAEAEVAAAGANPEDQDNED